MPRIALLGWAALGCVGVVNGSIYPVSESLDPHSARSFKDTPIFALKDSPMWLGTLSDPFVEVNGTISTVEDFSMGQTTGNMLFRVIHAWSSESHALSALEDFEDFYMCDKVPSSLDFDGYEIQPLYATIDTSGKQSLDFSFRFNVNVTAWHVTIVTNCMGSYLQLEADFIYKNPYGYLNGWAFGVLPLNMVLCLLYGILMMGFTFSTLKNRHYVLKLQYAIIAVTLMGFVERLMWVITYAEMNFSGGRPCCPVRGDLTFSVTLSVFKRASSVLLLLSVCLGFGVTKPKLSRQTTLKVIAMGLVYTLSSLTLELEKIEDVSENGRQTNPSFFMAMVVSISDVVLLFWIYYGINTSIADLSDAGQVAKLRLYNTLAKSLAIWVVLWFIVTSFEILAFQENVDIPWRYWYILVSFWDIFFFGILLQISYMWWPSELTGQYAFSQQLPTEEDLDEFDQIGLEMTGPDTASDFMIASDDESNSDNDRAITST